MKRVTGLGGVFLKAKDPKFLARWYEDNLGIPFGTNVYASLKWRDSDNTDEICTTAFSMFSLQTEYFAPSTKDLMLNFRVSNLFELLPALKSEGVDVMQSTEEHEYGKFGWVMDPEGNKIELWEPNESGFGEPAQTIPLEGEVNGFGGIFIKSKNPEAQGKWYSDHFGLTFQYGMHTFKWRQLNDASIQAKTSFTFFKEDTKYFQPSIKNQMLNFRVNNLRPLLETLKSAHVEVDPKIEDSEYGTFGWIMDPEGNRIELWSGNRN